MTLFIFKKIKFLKSFDILASTFLPLWETRRADLTASASLQPNRSRSLQLMSYFLTATAISTRK